MSSSDDESQKPLFEAGEAWEETWKGMPEFSQDDCEPFKTMLVHFRNWEDVQTFSRLLEQPISASTRFVWYPKADIEMVKNKRWVKASFESRPTLDKPKERKE
jgi:hypothetical protein